MKRLIAVTLAVVTLTFSATHMVNATPTGLHDNGDGTITDHDTNLMWLADANYAQTSGYDDDGIMAWADANTWSATLSFAGYDDWMLPSMLQPDPTCDSQAGSVSWGYNCTGSEMGHLFYNELGGTASLSILTSSNPDLALFSNLQPSWYWSGTEYAFDTANAWVFYFGDGVQSVGVKEDFSYSWAVRHDVSVTVPEPSAMLFQGFVLTVLFLLRKPRGRRDGII